MNNTSLSGSVDETLVFERRKSRMIERTWTKTAAIYPMPTPFEDILVDSLSSEESAFLSFCFR